MAAQPDNIMMLMMMVMPVATQVCMPVLQKFGFTADQGGLMAYVAATMKHKDDAEIAALGKEMRSTFVPEALEGVIGMMLAGPAGICLLYTSPSPRDKRQARMPSSA